MEAGYSSCNAALNGAASLGSPAGHNTPRGFLFQLPTELVIKIFQFALPSADSMLNEVEAQIISYMRTLSTIRLIAKRWQQIVDDIPLFWKFIISTLPPHVNEATIIRSKNGPLRIIYSCGPMYPGGPEPSAEDFLGSLAHTFPRWSAYSGPLVSRYFHVPAPHLQTIILKDGGTSIEALDLLGGSAKTLRHVHLEGILIRWKTGLFAQLKVLKLVNVFPFRAGFTSTHLLDALRASPYLEHLELGAMSWATVDHPPCIDFYDLRFSFAGAILRHIRAPSCTKLSLNGLVSNNEQDLSASLNEDLQNFQELFRGMHSRNGFSEITLDQYGFQWNSRAKDAEQLPGFLVFIFCYSAIPCISWVDHILQGDPSLSIRFTFNANIYQELLEIIKPMRYVTRLEIDDVRSIDESLLALRFLGEPLSTDPSSPSLPGLQELRLTGIKWTAQNVLGMVRSRFNSLWWKGTEWAPLTISVSRAFTKRGLPRPMIDLSTLAKIRETDGVECVQFIGMEELDGTLAITWDEEASAPAWV
ncbi:hypothetical protein FRC00_007561 [Tulasnella sp. 408]|nr:hypothetical protein FRC00_007561 [Tulasnella sp. 408]